jgi:hypothetical protein
MTATLARLEYRVLPSLDIEPKGVVRAPLDGDDKDADRRVHLMQGDADGACGPYCVFMALLVHGVARRGAFTGWGKVKGSTSEGKLLAKMEADHSALFRGGTDLEQLEALLDETYSGKVRARLIDVNGAACRTAVEAEVLAGNPVILGIDAGDDDRHFLLVVGTRNRVVGDTHQVDRFLVLDPAEPGPRAAPWNGVVALRGAGGRWWSGADDRHSSVSFFGALAVRRRT